MTPGRSAGAGGTSPAGGAERKGCAGRARGVKLPFSPSDTRTPHPLRTIKPRSTAPLAAALALACAPLAAQQDLGAVEITTVPLATGVFMLTGAGGNIGVSVGEDGVFVIDDQFAPLSEKILAAIGGLSDKPVSYVLNTHWHGDHTGGNENFGEAGAVVVAHENVRERMSTEQFNRIFDRATPPSPEAALPVVTFTENVTFHFNGETIRVHHMPAAHTDGDSIVYFEDADVLHAGDLFFNGFFPFIDTDSGGSLEGVIEAAEHVIGMVSRDTEIIPGHGPRATKIDVERYRDMLVEVRDVMAPIVASGKAREEVVADNPLGRFGVDWGGGFMKTDVFTGIVYDSLAGG